VTALVTTTGRTSTTATVVGILILVLILALLVVIGISGSTRRWSRGRTHSKARKSRLIATVGVLVRCVHGHPKLLLLLLLGKLEGVDLRRDTTHGAAWRKGVDLAQLLGLQETHVHVLLVCRGNLLLLLLKQLNLLLNSQLFH
jgi:hypothetical protein